MAVDKGISLSPTWGILQLVLLECRLPLAHVLLRLHPRMMEDMPQVRFSTKTRNSLEQAKIKSPVSFQATSRTVNTVAYTSSVCHAFMKQCKII